MVHLIHRNRVDHFADFPRNISPLRSPFPSGARLFMCDLVDWTSDQGNVMLSVLCNCSRRATENSLAPLWEDICKQIRPQRSRPEKATRLRWMRFIMRTHFC